MNHSKEYLTMEFRRYLRLYPRDEAVEQIVDYVLNRFHTHEERRKIVTPDDVKKVVTDYYKVGWEEVVEFTRKVEISKVRSAAIYLFTIKTKLSLKSIGKIFGRHHSTILVARDVLLDKMLKDKDLKNEVEQLISKFKS